MTAYKRKSLEVISFRYRRESKKSKKQIMSNWFVKKKKKKKDWREKDTCQLVK